MQISWIFAPLYFGLVKNYAFHDGNKRVALLTLLYQLNGYGYFPSAPVKEFEKLVVAVAASELAVKYRWAWKKFDIYDQHPTYQSIMSGRDPLYKLIADFEQPLHRLKDE